MFCSNSLQRLSCPGHCRPAESPEKFARGWPGPQKLEPGKLNEEPGAPAGFGGEALAVPEAGSEAGAGGGFGGAFEEGGGAPMVE